MPVITSGPTATNIQSTSATIEWTTDVSSDSEVEYELDGVVSVSGSIDQTLPSITQEATSGEVTPEFTGSIGSDLPSVTQGATGSSGEPEPEPEFPVMYLGTTRVIGAYVGTTPVTDIRVG